MSARCLYTRNGFPPFCYMCMLTWFTDAAECMCVARQTAYIPLLNAMYILCALWYGWCCYAGVNCAPNVALMTSFICPVNTGMNITMQCLAKDPTGSGLTYVWLRNGFQINQALSPTLMLVGVVPEDRGTYVCRVTNRLGQGIASTFLEVIGKVA